MKDIKKLRAALAAAKAKGITKLTSLNALLNKENLTAEETAQRDALDAEVTALETEVQNLSAEIADEEKKIRRQGLFSPSAIVPAAGGPARSFAVNDLNPETTGGFRSMAEFGMAVHRATINQGVDERLSAMVAAAPGETMNTGGSVGEGYLVPPEFRQQIWSLVFAEDELLARFAPEPTNSNAVSIVKDQTTPWGSTGVQAGWRNELGAMSASRHKHDNALVELHQLYAFVAASDELLTDAPRLASRLTTSAAAAIRYKAAEAIMTGNGTGRPLGFMNSPALVTVAKESGQAADTIVALNVANMYSRLVQGNLANAFWSANADTLPQLMTMTISNQPIWTPPNAGFAAAPGGFLLGRPVVFNEHGATVGDLGDLVLIDPSGYFLATKAGGGIDFASSIHLYFDQAATAFRWVFRVGGQPYMSAPVSPAKGNKTKSHFVALAERA